jgi:hypothetical protein
MAEGGFYCQEVECLLLVVSKARIIWSCTGSSSSRGTNTFMAEGGFRRQEDVAEQYAATVEPCCAAALSAGRRKTTTPQRAPQSLASAFS